LCELRQGEDFRKLCAMKGRYCFRSSEADEIGELLKQLRTAERREQKRMRDRLREIGFYISDWDGAAHGFTATDFDELVGARSRADLRRRALARR
jgi:hypothetical protein